MVDEGKQQLKYWKHKIQAALQMYEQSMDADKAIGKLPEKQARQHGALIQAGEALSQMLWSVAQANGAQKTDAVLKMWAQGQMVLYNLIHLAFALGTEWGRADVQE